MKSGLQDTNHASGKSNEFKYEDERNGMDFWTWLWLTYYRNNWKSYVLVIVGGLFVGFFLSIIGLM